MASNVAAKLPPPFIYVPGLPNLRDVGGLPVISSSSTSSSPSVREAERNGPGARLVVRKGVLYRAADPTFLTEEEIGFLHRELGITEIYDLRSEPEFEKQGTALQEWEERIKAYNEGSGSSSKIQRHWTPVFKTQDYSPESIALRFRDYGAEDGAQGFMRAYAEILKHGGPSYTKILRHLASPEAQPPTGILVHCSAGKDRTGVIVAVILRILGTPIEHVCREYQLTETGLEERRKFFMERLMSSGAFTGEEGRAAAERMTGAKAESMRATLEMVDKKYGSCEGYVREVCGLTDGDIEILRRNLTVREENAEADAGGGGMPSAAVAGEKAVL